MKKSKKLYFDDSEEVYEKKLEVKFSYMNKSQENLGNIIKNHELTLCIGPPGTAKTFISCAEALKILFDKTVSKIYIIKSVTTIPGEEIGFLKGGLDEKMDPFIFSFKHNFIKLIGDKKVKELFDSKCIEVLPIAYTRGISLDNCIVICDECQNLNVHSFRTLLTRIGKNCKMICLGDTEQIDLKNKSTSSLRKIFNIMEDPRIGKLELTLDDVVRNPLIQLIENLFSKL